MVSSDHAVAGLREAVRISPDNVPLRQTLAEMLMGVGRYEEAETEYRAALGQAPDEKKLKVGLAKAFYHQGKNSLALVIVEDLLKRGEAPADLLLQQVRVLIAGGNHEEGREYYSLALKADPAAADPELARKLGIVISAPAPKKRARRKVAQYSHEVELAHQPELSEQADVEHPKVSFSDVGGMEEVKEQIRTKIIHPLAHPELYKAYGKTIGGGILMYGPPGCGKTHLARASAGEIRASFMAIAITDVMDMWLGSSERNLHEIFEQARRRRPCVLFFDEVDALAASRADMRVSAGRHTINQFLSEMDGVGANNEGVLLLAATNAPWHVDPAFRRPGRFGNILFVPPPDPPARAAILRIHLKGRPVADIDHEAIVSATNAFSGADLKAVVELAIEAKLRHAIKTGGATPVSTTDLLAAVAKIKPSTQDWFASARNYALYANQGGTYDDLAKYLKT